MKRTWSNLKKCSAFLKECKKEIIIVLTLGVLVSIISAIIPSFNGKIINGILKYNYKKVIILAVILGILHTLYTVFNLIISKEYLTFKKKIVVLIRRKICKSLLNLNMEAYTINGNGSILNKVKADSKSVAVFLYNIKESLLNLVTSIAVLCYIFYLNWIVGLCYLIAIVILLLIQYQGVNKSIYYREKLLEVDDDNSTLIGEVLKGAKDIKTLGLKRNLLNKAEDSFDKLGEYEYKSNAFAEYSSKISYFMSNILAGVIVVISIILIKNKLLSTSNFIIIFMYKSNLFSFSSKVSNVISNMKQFNLSVERIFSILDYQKENYGIQTLKDYHGKISFQDIKFGYENKYIFDNFNLKIDANTFTVIVGKNGAGKSTLFSLLTKVITPESGNIYLDNMALSELTEESIRSNISLVTQQPYLFHFSIKENFNLIDDDFEHIKKVCKEVGIDKKIESLKQGYDTKLMEDGINLSGGEKQKIAIARALLSKTKVLLLDEITNNLDKESTSSIIELITRIKDKYTIVMITHNLEIMKKADRIIILEDGKIVGDGNHKMLKKTNGYYQKIGKE